MENKDFVYFTDYDKNERSIIKGYIGNEKHVIIPENVQMIEFECFTNKKNIESVEIPESVELIKNGAFSGCTNLKSVKIPDNLRGIGADTFGDAESTAKYLLENPNYEEINGFIVNKTNKTILFALDYTKESYTIPEGYLSIGAYAFMGCTELKEISIPEPIQNISIMAFFLCEKLTRIIFPKTLKIIDKAAFVHCNNLKNVSLPEGVEVEFANDCLFENKK